MERELQINELLKELSRLEERLFTLEIMDDWCYTNGSAYPLIHKIAELREQINTLRENA